MRREGEGRYGRSRGNVILLRFYVTLVVLQLLRGCNFHTVLLPFLQDTELQLLQLKVRRPGNSSKNSKPT